MARHLPRIDLLAMLGCGLLALGFQFFRRAETAVGLAFGEQLLGVRAIDVEALGLAIGAVRAAARSAQFRAFIPCEAHPVQVLHQLGFMARFAALEIGVFDAKDEVSAGVAGEEPVVEGGAGVAYVEQPGRRWRETDARLGVRHDDYLDLIAVSLS